MEKVSKTPTPLTWVSPSHCFLPFKPRGSVQHQSRASINPAERLKHHSPKTKPPGEETTLIHGHEQCPSPAKNSPAGLWDLTPSHPHPWGRTSAPCGTKLVLGVPEMEVERVEGIPSLAGTLPHCTLALPQCVVHVEDREGYKSLQPAKGYAGRIP